MLRILGLARLCAWAAVCHGGGHTGVGRRGLGVFATPGDASRSGDTVVATVGPLRLLLELAVFFGGAAAAYVAGAQTPALVLAIVLVAYHAVSLDRIGWLLRN